MPDLKEILLSKNVVIPEDYQIFKNIFRHFKGKQIENIAGDDRPLLDKPNEFYLKSPQNPAGFLQGDVLANISPIWIQSN